jgi:hypothetical protein
MDEAKIEEGPSPGTDDEPRANAIYQQPWFLSAVAPGAWSEVTTVRDGKVTGRLPFITERRLGLTTITQPELAATLGPWVRPTTGSPAAVLSHEMAVVRELIEQLPPHDAFHQSLSPAVASALPFHWAGWDLEMRYTYRVDLRTPEEERWATLAPRLRTEIRKARRTLEVRTGLPMARFYEVWRGSWDRQGIAPPHDLAELERVHAACTARGAGEALFAVDASGRVHAVNYYAWDGGLAHGLLAGADPAVRAGGGQTLLLWEVLCRARDHAATFDLSGSMMPRVEPLFRDFCAHQVPYVHVSRRSDRLQALVTGREAVRYAGSAAQVVTRRAAGWASARAGRSA